MFGQTHFPDSNAIWNVNIFAPGHEPEILYGLKGDTIINDTLYNKLYTLSDTALLNENLQDYIGGFRRDGQKVFFKPSNWTYDEILLYDFSASIGDTIWHKGIAYNAYYGINFEPNQLSYSIVQAINTENATKTYSVLASYSGFSGEWYENIGSNFGLFGSIIQFPLSGDTYNLACFKHNDTVKYQNNLICDRCFCSFIDEKINNSNSINIFPNPVKNLLTIEVQKPYSKILVEIIDEKGNIVYQKASLDDHITLNAFSQGIYFVKLLLDNESITRKLIIE